MNRRPRLVAGLVAGSVLVLAGCAGSGPQPGVAATVGDQVVTTDTVDLASSGLCTFFADEIEQQGAVAYSSIKQNVAVLLTLRTAVEQLADEVSAEASSDYRRQESSLEEQTADLEPADERDALVAAIGAEPYVLALVPEIGERLLSDEGQSDPSPEESGARGLEALTSYLSENDVEFAPSLGLTYNPAEPPEEGAPVEEVVGTLFDTEDTSTSVGTSEVAELAQQPDADYTASLPSNQRCGG